MRILGIESSCDETAIAVVSGEGDRLVVEHNLVASQADLHATYGGVVPEVAARRHTDVIFPLLLAAGIPRDGSGIDAIAVTAGPGLVPALRIGVELGKTLAWVWKSGGAGSGSAGKPLVAVNHLEGHVYSVWLGGALPMFPALCLLVSGGHTELVLMRDHGKYELIGKTRDDAVGEAFDKVAKLLGLGYPGGPAISKFASQGKRDAIMFPRPMLESGDFDFSFSGLKTAVLVRRQGYPDDRVEDVCASFEEAVVDTLVAKTVAAVQKHHPASVILAGGVSANKRLRERLAQALPIPLHAPEMNYTGDNAAMIAAAGFFRAMNKDFTDPLQLAADPNLRLAQ